METRKIYIRYSLIIILLLLGLVVFKELLPFLSGILGATTIYILLRNQLFYLTEKRKMSFHVAATLLLIETSLFFLIPISIAIWMVVNQIVNIHLNPVSFISSTQHISDLIAQRVGYDLLSKENISTIASYLPELGTRIMGSIGSFVVNIFVLLFVLYFMFIGGRKIEGYIYDLLPFTNENKKNVLREIKTMVRSNAIGIPLLAIIQGLAALVGYLIFGVPNPFLFAFITCFATILPLVGTSLVWFPLSVYLALTGDWYSAIALAVYALAIITNIDNFVRFMLQKKIANTHPLITVFGVVIGLSLFGFWGVIFGPLVLSVFLLCLNIFKSEYLENRSGNHL